MQVGVTATASEYLSCSCIQHHCAGHLINTQVAYMFIAVMSSEELNDLRLVPFTGLFMANMTVVFRWELNFWVIVVLGDITC